MAMHSMSYICVTVSLMMWMHSISSDSEMTSGGANLGQARHIGWWLPWPSWCLGPGAPDDVPLGGLGQQPAVPQPQAHLGVQASQGDVG